VSTDLLDLKGIGKKGLEKLNKIGIKNKINYLST